MKFIPLLILTICLSAGALRAAPESPATPPPATKAPVRLVFKSYDGDPRKDKPEHFSFQIDAIDRRQPSEFLKLGEQIPNTHFKLLKFEFEEARDAKLQEDVDVSELTIVNIVTAKTAVLTYNKVVDISAMDAPTQQSK